MSDGHPFSDFPPAIVALLRDEANLLSAHHVLDEARADALQQLEAARSQRPAFGILGSKKQREDYAQTISSLEAQMVAIDALLNRVSTAHQRLQPSLRAALAQHLNHTDPSYRQGFRASRFHEHWRRAHAVVHDRMKGFVRDTRETRTAIARDAERGRVNYSNDALWHLGNWKKAAIELDREVEGFNRVCADFVAAVHETPFASVRLPSVEPFACSQIVDTLTLRAPADGLAEIDEVLADFSEARPTEFELLKTAFATASAEHDQLAEARLQQYWSGLQVQAETYLLSDAELEPTLMDIERRQAEFARMQLDGQVTRPFDSER